MFLGSLCCWSLSSRVLAHVADLWHRSFLVRLICSVVLVTHLVLLDRVTLLLGNVMVVLGWSPSGWTHLGSTVSPIRSVSRQVTVVARVTDKVGAVHYGGPVEGPAGHVAVVTLLGGGGQLETGAGRLGLHHLLGPGWKGRGRLLWELKFLGNPLMSPRVGAVGLPLGLLLVYSLGDLRSQYLLAVLRPHYVPAQLFIVCIKSLWNYNKITVITVILITIYNFKNFQTLTNSVLVTF